MITTITRIERTDQGTFAAIAHADHHDFSDDRSKAAAPGYR